MCARHASERHLANVLGALGVAIAGDVQAEVAAFTESTLSVGTAVNVIGSWGAGSSVDELARALGVTHSRAVRIADKLETDGLLERRRGDTDGRQVALHPTERGRHEASLLHQVRERAMERWLAPLDAEERATLGALVDKMLEARPGEAVHTCRLCDATRCGHPGRCPVTRGSRHA